MLPRNEYGRLITIPRNPRPDEMREIYGHGLTDDDLLCIYCGADEMTDHPDGESGQCDACKRRQ
jgi:hypothetical protein